MLAAIYQLPTNHVLILKIGGGDWSLKSESFFPPKEAQALR